MVYSKAEFKSNDDSFSLVHTILNMKCIRQMFTYMDSTEGFI